jgi:ribosomal protein S18 acetylase RimI-like enzyme
VEPVRYTFVLDGTDWEALKAALAADRFDNGRTPEQLRESFERSALCVLAWLQGRVVGTARVLSDGVCNAYVVDVWTHSSCRARGIATRMMELLMSRLEGLHVCLFAEEAEGFYERLGFREERTGMSRIVGSWLRRDQP